MEANTLIFLRHRCHVCSTLGCTPQNLTLCKSLCKGWFGRLNLSGGSEERGLSSQRNVSSCRSRKVFDLTFSYLSRCAPLLFLSISASSFTAFSLFCNFLKTYFFFLLEDLSPANFSLSFWFKLEVTFLFPFLCFN